MRGAHPFEVRGYLSDDLRRAVTYAHDGRHVRDEEAARWIEARLKAHLEDLRALGKWLTRIDDKDTHDHQSQDRRRV